MSMFRHAFTLRSLPIFIVGAVIIGLSFVTTPVRAVGVPFNITGTIDASDPIFDPNKTLLDCTGVWTGTNWHYETRTITVDQAATLNIRDVNNSMPGSPNPNDVAYGVYDITSTPFNASNLPLTSQCIGAATNNLNVSLSPGNTYLIVIENFYSASGGSYDLRVTSTNGAVNVVVGTPGGAPPPAPTITSITSAAANGNYGMGVTFDIQVNFSEPVQYGSIGVFMTLALNNGGSAVCTYCNQYPTPASSTYNFTYTTSAAVADLDIAGTNALQLNSGTLQSAGGTTVNITLPAPGAAGSLGANKNIAIVNPTLSVNNVTVTEGNSGTVAAGFTASLSHALVAPTVTVNYATANVSATAGSDYVAASGSLTFNPGTTTRPMNVTVNGDNLNEADETFRVNLSGASGASVSGFGTGTITNDDPPPSISIDDVTVTEGDAGSVNAIFTVSVSAPSGQTITVNYATANNTAASGSDYAAATGTLTFAPAATSQTVTVTVNGDTLDEVDETYFVNLSTPVNATISDSQGLGTITDDDLPPTISTGNATVTEGNAGTVNAAFTVSLSAASGQTVTVDYASADGTATAGSDYVAASGTLTFPAGTMSLPVNVTVNGDTLFEINEAFTVTLSNPINTSITTAIGTGIITNDDGPPAVSINDVTLTEGNAGTVNASFTASLSNASYQTITLDYATADGTGIAGGDYTATTGTLTFVPSTTTQTMSVTVNGDTLFEGDETFFVNLSNPTNATISDTQGQGNITNDDSQPTFSIGDVTLAEGNSGTTSFSFTVTRVNNTNNTDTLDFATADGTALAGGDYAAASGTLTFNPGDVTQAINVTVNGDISLEGNETFVVNLSNASTPAAISDNQGIGTINNDDTAAGLSINDLTLAEGNSGTSTFSFTVSRTGDTTVTTTVDFATADGSTVVGSDYGAAGGTLIFSPGNTSQTVNVTVNGDISLEADESFFVNLSNASTPAIINDNQGVGTITNDDVPAGLSINDVTLVEGNSGTATMTFTISRGGDTTVTTTVDFATADSSATTANNDYVAANGTLTFNPGDTTQSVSVSVNGDVIAEGDETFFVNLSNATAPAILSDNQGVGTITNDEAPPGLSVSDVTVGENSAAGQFTVSLNPANGVAVTVDYTISDGTALNGTHYIASMTGTLTFNPGDTAQTIPFAITDNTLVDGNHNFSVTLSNSNGPVIVRATSYATIIDNEITIITLPAAPPAPACTDVNFDPDSVVRTHFTNDVDRAALNCRLIASNGNYLDWNGGPLTTLANIGNQTVLDLGVIAAVDVFSPGGASGFVGDVNICLKGRGYMIYLNANGQPRVAQLWSSWTSDAFPGYTCTTLYAPGTVVLVQRKP